MVANVTAPARIACGTVTGARRDDLWHCCSMRLVIFTEPQNGASYDDQLRIARAAEAGGYDGIFRSHHYGAVGGDGLRGPTDSWLALGALAVQASRIRLGTLVSSA